MPLDCSSLYELSHVPKINDISLLLLTEYDEKYLIPYEYHIKCNFYGEKKLIKLRFDKENFCHLLGIESIAKRHVNSLNLIEYRGIKGWENIKREKITISSLKKLNKNGFNSNKVRYLYFFLLPWVLDHPKVVNYDGSHVTPKTHVTCKFLLFDDRHEKKIHLGIDFSREKGYYVPRTFLIESITKDSKGDKFIASQ